MKQEDANKLMAVFMAFIMLFSIGAYFMSGPSASDETEPEQLPVGQDYNPEFWTVNEPFFSISDSLKMTPYNSTSAVFVDIDAMTPQMAQWVRQEGLPLINEVDSIYKSQTTKMYYTIINDGENESFLLLSTMNPEKNDFQYMVNPYSYGYHYILIRQEEQYNGIRNVMGTPTIFAPPDTAFGVLEIITSLNKTHTAYERYDGLLNNTDPAAFQNISSDVDFADQYYMGIGVKNGSYERTTIYLNINSSTMKKLQQLKANSTERGFSQYDISQAGRITGVRISGTDFLKIINEESS